MNRLLVGEQAPTSRTCSRCHIAQPISAFYERSERPIHQYGHWHSTCRSCLLKVKRAKYAADPVKAAETRKTQRKRRAAKGLLEMFWGA